MLAFSAPAAAQDPEREAAVEALEQAEAIAEGGGVRTGRELSPALAALAARRADLSRSQRREADTLLARPTDPGDDGPGALGPYTVPSTRSCSRPGTSSSHFCVHWVETTNDAPPGADGNNATVPPYIRTMQNALETAYTVENEQLGWRLPVPDGSRGGNTLPDVYVQDIGNEGIFGYASVDPGQVGRSRSAYLVMDDDYAEFGDPPQGLLEVTAAHEYNHVLQYAYDTFQDTWMFESTATWAEEKVFDAVNDYLFYLQPWAGLPGAPLTSSGDGVAPSGDDLKMYGSAVWNHWLESKYGASVVRQAWVLSQAASVAGGGFAPAAYDRAIREQGGPGFTAELEDFTASTAEWDAADSGVREGASFPDVVRSGTLALNGAAASGVLDHTAFALYEVPLSSAANLRLTGTIPAGTAGSIALVGIAGGSMTKVLGVLDSGTSTVTLPGPGRFERITAVVTNADTAQAGFGAGDWRWLRDAQPFSLSVSDVEPAPPPSPAPAPPPAPTASAASLRLASGSQPRLRRVARRGILSLTATVNKAGRLTASATVDRRTARRLRVARKAARVGTGRRTATRAGRVKLSVRLTRKARTALRRHRRALRIKVRVRFVPAGGGKAVVRTVSVRLRP